MVFSALGVTEPGLGHQHQTKGKGRLPPSTCSLLGLTSPGAEAASDQAWHLLQCAPSSAPAEGQAKEVPWAL